MAYRANRKMSIGYGNQKPWCKFCHDMGFEGYDTHYTKDKRGPGGKVVCPKLLSMECRSCGEKGHVHTHCTHMHTHTNSADNNRKAYETPRPLPQSSRQSQQSSLTMIPRQLRHKLNESPSNESPSNTSPSIGQWNKKLDFSNDAEVKRLNEQVETLKKQNMQLRAANEQMTIALQLSSWNNYMWNQRQCEQQLFQFEEPMLTEEICEALDKFEEEEAASEALAEMTYERNIEDDFVCDVNNADYEGEQKQMDVEMANKIWEQNMMQPNKKSSCALPKKVNFQDLVENQTNPNQSWTQVVKKSRKRVAPRKAVVKKDVKPTTNHSKKSANMFDVLSEREIKKLPAEEQMRVRRRQASDNSSWGEMAEEDW